MTPVADLPKRTLAGLGLGFAVTTAALQLLASPDPASLLVPIGAPTEAVFSTLFPVPFLDVAKGGATIPRKKNEVRAFFVGASETYALPYDPPGRLGYAFQLGAGYQAATGRSDIHVRGEANPALDSTQIVDQAFKVLEFGDPSLIVLVVGANEYLSRLVRGKPVLPASLLEHVADRASRARLLWRMLAPESAAPATGASDFAAFVRQAAPGRPALKGIPIGKRDRALLMDRLRAGIVRLHVACRARGSKLALALSLHSHAIGMPWCSALEPAPPEVDALVSRVRDGAGVTLAEVDALLESSPLRADLHWARAMVLHRGDRRAEARDEFEKALDLDLVPLHQTSEVRAVLRATAAELGLPFIDLSDAFRDATGYVSGERFLDYAHPDLEGHRKLALWLAHEWGGSVLPALPPNSDTAFEAGMAKWSEQATDESKRLAHARMSATLGQWLLAFGNFRDALPLLERAARELNGSDGFEGAARDLAVCERKLREAAR